MGLRGKLAAFSLLLLIIPALAVSALEVDRTIAVMVDDLSAAGTLIADQTFAQVRDALNNSAGDPAAALRKSKSLLALLGSSRAFGKGVVYVSVEKLNGEVLSSAGSAPAGQSAFPAAAFSDLSRRTDTLWPLTRVQALWSERTYELNRVVELNGRPFALIRVGLSTALISTEVRRAVEGIGAIAVVAVALGALAAFAFGGLVLRRPLTAIAASVEQMALEGDAVRLKVGGGDELSVLAEKFNQLSMRIHNRRNQWENERGQFFNIFRSITDAVLLLDAAGAVLFCNSEAQARLGLPASGVAEGKRLQMLLPSDHPLLRLIAGAYAAGTEVRDIALDAARDSTPEHFLVSIFSLGQGPEPPGLLVIMRDLQPVQELEHVVDYSGRLARLGGLISGVAHQIRNPLNAMTLQLELLRQDAAQNRDVTPRVQAVRDEIGRLDRVVGALMRFMRPERLKLTDVKLEELVAETVGHIGPHSAAIELQLDPGLEFIRVDRALFGEALRNVISNAVEATQGNGIVTIASTMAAEGMAEISVADNGVGIPAENLDSIFRLYFTTKETGSGLGLSLAMRAIDLHGGTIEVKSRVGVGTTVTIRLPGAGDNRAVLVS